MRKSDQYILLPLSVLNELSEVCAAAEVWYERNADEAATDSFRDFSTERAMSADKMFSDICAAPCITVCKKVPGKIDYTDHPRKDVW